jgi:hypothetical protein
MRFKTLILTLLVMVGLASAPASAQTALTATTISAAMTATQTTVTVASATSIVAGWVLYIDREAVLVRSITSTTAVISRGQMGTAPAAHGSGAGVLAQAPAAFSLVDPSGACSTLTETYLPRVSVVSGNLFDCVGSTAGAVTGAGYWVRHKQGGFTTPSFYGLGTISAYTASGALDIRPGVTTVAGGSAQSYTLANPSEAQNGMIMIIICKTTYAHTVTVATGIADGANTSDVATFAAIGDSLVVVAVHGKWYLISFRGTSLA